MQRLIREYKAIISDAHGDYVNKLHAILLLINSILIGIRKFCFQIEM